VTSEYSLQNKLPQHSAWFYFRRLKVCPTPPVPNTHVNMKTVT